MHRFQPGAWDKRADGQTDWSHHCLLPPNKRGCNSGGRCPGGKHSKSITMYKSLFTENSVATQKHNSATTTMSQNRERTNETARPAIWIRVTRLCHWWWVLTTNLLHGINTFFDNYGDKKGKIKRKPDKKIYSKSSCQNNNTTCNSHKLILSHLW